MRKLHFFSILVALSLATTSLWAVPTGALPGAFTINNKCDMVYFSQGNLQYVGTWKFAEKQYEFFGNSQSDDHRDLFGWGTGNNPNNTSYSGYSTYVEWGNNAITNGGNNEDSGWRTLTRGEWDYLFKNRATGSSVNGTSDARWTHAKILIDGEAPNKDICGIILFPDGYTGGTPIGVDWGTINGNSAWGTTCTSSGWLALEAAGCIFIPAAGYRDGTTLIDIGTAGRYWTASGYSGGSSYRLTFSSGNMETYFGNVYFGYSVRLVKDLTTAEKKASVTTAPDAIPDLVYTGSAQTLVTAGTAKNGTMKYRLGTTGSFTTTIPTATDAGTYTVQYYAEGTGCFASSATGSVDVTIANAVFDNADPSATLTALYNGGSPTSTNLIVNRTIYADGEYNTICLPFALDASALAASPLAGFNNLKTIKGASVTGSGQALSIDIFVEDVTEMEAGKPYLISYPSAHPDIVNPVFENITVTTTTPGSVTADGITFRGMFAQVHIDPYTNERDEDYLFLGANSQLMWPLSTETSESVKMRGFRAYFIIDRNAIPAQVAPRGTHARFVNAPKQPTSIENTELNTQAQKLLENGQLIILKNGIKYNAQGQVLK